MENNPHTVIVTGASRGIGAATAKSLTADGYQICINYRANESAANTLAEELRTGGATVMTMQADVSLEDEVLGLFESVEDRMGAIHALVNNAAILLPQMRLEGMDAERINRMLTTNVTSAFLCCREAVKRMSTRHGGKGGSIVNVSSAAARIGVPGEYIDYAASNGAIDTLTRGLALEVASEGIRGYCHGRHPPYSEASKH